MMCEGKIVRVDCGSIYDAMSGFNLVEVEKLVIEVVNEEPELGIEPAPVAENEIVDIILAESVSE
jgi:hypothetical protein